MPARTGCCSYTVRCYAPDGETKWTADYFRDAIAGEYDLSVQLSVTTIGDRVFVGGPRVSHVFGGGTTYWNLCVYDLASGGLISKADLWDSAPYDLSNGNGDVQDVCGGDDGQLGVLFWQTNGATHLQLAASFDPVSLTANWTTRALITGRSDPFLRIQIDAAGLAHVGGEAARHCLVLDGTSEYVGGSRIDSGAVWWAATGFCAKIPGPNGPSGSIANAVINSVYNNVVSWPPHLTEENVATPPTPRSQTWWTVTTRGTTVGLDALSGVNDIALIRSSGVPTRAILVGSGFVRGDSGTAMLPDGFTPPFPSDYAVAGTAGSIADQGCVGVFDVSGSYDKAYSPTGMNAIGKVEASLLDAGYYLGSSRLLALPTLLARDATDGHLWAHRHQSLSDLAAASDGGCVTVGERSKRSSGEADFIGPF